jgi:hypothetical protein
MFQRLSLFPSSGIDVEVQSLWNVEVLIYGDMADHSKISTGLSNMYVKM